MRYNYDNLYFADEETEEDRGKKNLPSVTQVESLHPDVNQALWMQSQCS